MQYYLQLKNTTTEPPVWVMAGHFLAPGFVGPGTNTSAKLWKTRKGAERFAIKKFTRNYAQYVEIVPYPY